MVRFFVNPRALCESEIMLDGENAAHAKVLRLKCGECVTVCDGEGKEAIGTIKEVGAGFVKLNVGEMVMSSTEPEVQVSVYVAFPKSDKIEHVIQKATELGAFEIVAFPSARCVSKPDARTLRKKAERWNKIALAAAEQSGRGRIPRVLVLESYQEALERARQTEIGILFYENENSCTLHSVLTERKYRSVSLLTGPEGGLEPGEVQRALNAGLRVCTLGKRILRCETAPLCALSAVMYEAGEF